MRLDRGARRQRDPSTITRARVFRLWPDDAIGAPLLERMRDPSAHPTDRKRRGKERDVETESVEQQRGVELDVRLQPSAGFVLLEYMRSAAFASTSARGSRTL